MRFCHYVGWHVYGLGTSEVESLTSAVRRLAHAEVRGVGEVLRECVIEPYRIERRQRQPIIQPTRVLESVNGASVTTRVIIDRIASAGGPNLERTTLLRRDHGIEFREAFRAQRAWCPACLEADGDEAYDRLTWALRASRSCTRHRVALVDRCAHCGRGHRPWHARANPWSCPHCGGLLATGPTARVTVDGDSSAVRDLIALFESGSLTDRARVAAGFDALRSRVGGLRVLATRLDHSLAGLSTLCRGLTRPHLALMLRALALADESLAMFLGHEPVPMATARRSHVRRAPPTPSMSLEHDFRYGLLAAASPSLRELARARRVDVATLRRRFPILARQLVRERRAREARRRQSAEVALAQSVRAVFARFTRSGHVPTRRQMEAALGRPGVFRAPAARRAFAEILRESAI